MSFNLPPSGNSSSSFLSEEEKEKKAEAFMDLIDPNAIKKPVRTRFIKEKTQPLLIRFPISLMEDIREISAITGVSMNSVCLELMRPAVKKRLKELLD